LVGSEYEYGGEVFYEDDAGYTCESNDGRRFTCIFHVKVMLSSTFEREVRDDEGGVK